MDKVIKLSVDTKAIDKICIGGMLYDALDYGNINNVFERDKEGNMRLSEEKMLKLIDLVNKDNILSQIEKVKIS